MAKDLPDVVLFNQVDKQDISLVGGKGANLGEMIKADLPIPPGFIVTAPAYYKILDKNRLQRPIKDILKTCDVHDSQSLNSASLRIKNLILKAQIPDDLALNIIKTYLKLSKNNPHPRVAVRSSATAEDLPDASFAGQQETYLNVVGEANVVQHVRKCWASLFEPRAIFYRSEKGFDHFKVGIAVPVQLMVDSEVSGIMFTVNPVTNDKNQVVIEAIWGLGEKIVQGAYTPDHYIVQKLTWKLLQKQINPQNKYLTFKKNKNREIKVKKSKRNKVKLEDDQIIELAKLGHQIQQHYFFPQDIEWAYQNKKFYIVQSRPVTTYHQQKEAKKTFNRQELKLLLKGDPASPGIASGFPRVLKSAKQISQIKTGEILVTQMTTPDFVPAMKKAVAIITDQGGQTSHAAIVSRELGIPCIVGTQKATKIIKSQNIITVNGQTGEIFLGAPKRKTKKIKTIEKSKTKIKIKKKDLKPEPELKTATKLYVNLAEPELASEIAQKNVDGVGLLRAEFIIAQIGKHPKKFIHDHQQDKFIDKLTSGVKQFCRHFNPRPIIYRATDFKTNEYQNLIGGQEFEPQEQNPMIGLRGAYRYINDQKVFALELEAIKKIRNKYKFKNLNLMIPFVRSVEELKQIKKIIYSHGLYRSPSFKLWMMVEIPSNVIQLEEYIKLGIDGVSIGTNDLTMLMLGVDRDNSEVAPIYDERNPAVLWALEKIIKTCHQHKITSSICGQAPSVYPDLTQKLVSWGITSVSVAPDMIDQTRDIIYQAEKNLVK